jgi:predicted DNA-binding transcriptional regulator YafY
LREQAASIRKRLHVDTTGWSGTPENLSMLEVVQDAVSRDRRLAIRYWPTGREAGERIVDPLGLVAKGGTWYLVARTPRGLRTFRVSRIETARLLDEGFERPADFDLAAHWNASTAELRRGRERYEVTLRLAPDAAVSFQKWRRAPSAPPSAEAESEGWVTLSVPFDDEAQAAFVVLGLGPKVDVVQPASLRARVAADHAAALARSAG